METHLEGLAEAGEEFAVKEIMVSYTVDCIATTGFGFEANSFKEPDGQFRKMVSRTPKLTDTETNSV